MKEQLCVTTPDLEDRADFLLGVVQSEISSGSDQAHVFLNLKYFEITDKIYGICCDTTSSNIGEFSGATSILTKILDMSPPYV